MIEDSTRMADLLDRQRRAFLHEGPPNLASRKARLARLRAAALAHREALKNAVSADFGNRSLHETDCARLLARTTSGNVGINNTLMHVAQDDLPFGGVGPSGMGAYHGIEGFRAMSHAKGVFVQGRWNLPSLLHAPFGKLADMAVSLTLGKPGKHHQGDRKTTTRTGTMQ